MELPPMRPQSAMPMPLYHQQQPLTGIENPHNHDVLCGRGVTTNRHVGNESFRSLVNCNKELYVTSTKKQKMKISRSIVEAVRSLEPPGRFLEKDQNSAKWFDIGDKKAVEKTSQALRDGAAGLRKQLSEDLCDPDFLSAVFDMDVAPPDKKAPIVAKKEKKVPPKKGHRRTKSNPTPAATGRSKNLIKKQTRGFEVPMSPRTRHSIAVTVSTSGKPPQSPGPMSPSSLGGSPRTIQPPMNMDNSVHRRAHSQGAGGPHVPTSPIGFYPRIRPAQRSSHFEYHDNPDRRRPPPAPYGSPGPHFPPPPPRSPSAHPGSPYGRPYHPPISPRWSPRSGYSRSGPSLSPHPYMHPSDFHRRHSPDHRPPTSPRDNYARPHPHYPASHGRPRGHSPTSYHSNNPHLSVPALGGEHVGAPHSHHRHLPISPSRYGRHPSSPRHHSGLGARSSPLPVDFTPPQSRSRAGSGSYRNTPEMPISMNEERYADEKKQDEAPERTLSMEETYSKDLEAAPFDEKPSSESPSAVADVAESNAAVKRNIMPSPSRVKVEEDEEDDAYPSDEDPDPAASRCLSPLPFDSHEDPNSLMELPENILSLPISPCGPNDGEI